MKVKTGLSVPGQGGQLPICIECGEGVDPRDEVLVGDSVIHRGECDAAWTWKFQVACTRADERCKVAAAMRTEIARLREAGIGVDTGRIWTEATLHRWADKIERGEIK